MENKVIWSVTYSCKFDEVGTSYFLTEKEGRARYDELTSKEEQENHDVRKYRWDEQDAYCVFLHRIEIDKESVDEDLIDSFEYCP